MAFKEDLEAEVRNIFRNAWSTRDGEVVPEAKDLGLGNDAVSLEGTVLYADLSGSTKMVDERTPAFAAEIYKTYLLCAAKLIRNEGGTITAYDGDRIMGVFIGSYKNTSAVRCGLKINAAVQTVITPLFKAQYPETTFALRQAIGIDTSKLLVARIGAKGDNDLVWVGRAANYAAKLTELDADYPTRITSDVFNVMDATVKFGSNGQAMWEKRLWTSMSNMEIYRSSWLWNL